MRRLSSASFWIPAAFSLALAACNPDSDSGGVSPDFGLQLGGIDTQQMDCSTHAVQKHIDQMCSIPGFSCHSSAASCGNVGLELFAGVDVIDPAGSKSGTWGFGGPGSRNAKGALCVLRDLMHGSSDQMIGVSTPVGTISVTQSVGATQFDPNSKHWEGYHTQRICLPAFGCMSGVDEKLTANYDSIEYAVNSSGGTNQQDNKLSMSRGAGLIFYGTTSQHASSIQPPSIQVDTPYGALEATITFTYGDNTAMHTPKLPDRTGFQGELGTYSTSKLGMLYTPVFLPDLLGIGNGVNFTRNPEAPEVECTPGSICASASNYNGWDSTAAFGQRGVDADEALWSPSSTSTATSYAARPDVDGLTSREASEKTPSTSTSASLCIKYSPLDLLPAPLPSLAGLEFFIQVCPTVSASASSQVSMLFGEGDPTTPPDVFKPGYGSGFVMQQSLRAHAQFDVTAELKLEAKLDTPFGDITIVDLDPKTDLKISDVTNSKTKSASALTNQALVSGGDSSSGPYSTIQSLNGTVWSGAQAKQMVDACLAPSAAVSQPEPNQDYKPENAQVLVDGSVWPCNVCLIVNSYKGKAKDKNGNWVDANIPYTQKVLSPSGDTWAEIGQPGKGWTCGDSAYVNKNAGCFDLCQKAPNGLIPYKSARDLFPDRCLVPFIQ